MSYSTINGMRSARYPLQGSGDGIGSCGSACGCGGCGSTPGLGVDTTTFEAAYVLGGIAVAGLLTVIVVGGLVWASKRK